MKTSDSDLKVNRNIYPDAVTCDRMRLIGPKSGQLGPTDPGSTHFKLTLQQRWVRPGLVALNNV